MSSGQHLVTRAGLAVDGWQRPVIDVATDRQLHRVAHGMYSYTPERYSVLAALLERGGPSAVLSHRFFAHLHGFDLCSETPPIELTVPYGSTFHPVGVRDRDAAEQRRFVVHRSRTLNPYDVTLHDGLWPVTNKARTLLDLSRMNTPDRLEIMLESALRSSDRFEPTAWDQNCLTRLAELADTHPAAGWTVTSGACSSTSAVSADRKPAGNDVAPSGKVSRAWPSPTSGEVDRGRCGGAGFHHGRS